MCQQDDEYYARRRCHISSNDYHSICGAAGQNHKAAGNDIILDIFGLKVTIQDIAILHPNGTALQRDIGIIVQKTAHDTILQRIRVERQRTGTVLEPTNPGSPT